MSSLRRALVGVGRLARLGLHMLCGLWTIYTRFGRFSHAERNRAVEQWAAQLLRCCGVELKLLGVPPQAGPALLVANHLSWLDIPLMHACKHVRFVSKSDVKQWPVVGTLASAGGTLYIERSSRRDAMRTVERMAQALREGDLVAIFPEGTTGDGRRLLPFHANLLQAAIDAEAPILPVGLCFYDRATGAPSYAPSYVGDETLLGSIWRTVTAPPLVAQVHYGELEHANGRDRRAWGHHLHRRVDRLWQSR
ncbi:MAG: lysophospholipid acyltransferase family protein [Comamonas sp.]